MANRFNLDEYEPVAVRIARFYNDHPTGQIHSDIVASPTADRKTWVIKAEVWREDTRIGRPDATGYACEVEGQGHVNSTSALENCETSAIGRALANLGYATTAQRPSREEMTKTARVLTTDGMATDQQKAEIKSLFRSMGIDPKARPQFIVDTIDKHVTSLDDLTVTEATKVIGALK